MGVMHNIKKSCCSRGGESTINNGKFSEFLGLVCVPLQWLKPCRPNKIMIVSVTVLYQTDITIDTIEIASPCKK